MDRRLRSYRPVSAQEFVDLGLARAEIRFDGAAVGIPELRYGTMDLSGPTIREEPSREELGNTGDALHVGPAIQLVVPNARVHTHAGAVTAGRYLLADSLLHVWPPDIGAARPAEDAFVFGADVVRRRVRRAGHLLCGGAHNYYHWLLDGVGRWAAVAGGADPVLLPWSGQGFQREVAALLPGLAGLAEFVGQDEVVDVDELFWCANLTGAGAAYHPALLHMANAIRLAVNPLAGHERIYVSRSDAQKRRLLNEPAVERLCAERGFRVVRLAGMSLRAQIGIFAAARHIVAPHGAGLANLLFCRPGAAVLELHMDRYVNWCFRRLAGLRALNYGCVIGTARPDATRDWPHDGVWTLDLDSLADVLDDPRFQAG